MRQHFTFPLVPHSRHGSDRAIRVAAIALAFLGLQEWNCKADGPEGPASQFKATASALSNRTFSWKVLSDPDPIYWPGYFWNWNGSLNPGLLRSQLADMRAHDARSVCVLPLPHEFRPESTNNEMSPGYLTPEFFERIKLTVDEASRLGMNYWLYDEGGWPSGQAAGRVLRANPGVAGRSLVRDASGAWVPRREGNVDLLDPKATETFIRLTHERYASAVGAHLGKTIKFVFTDEPAYRPVDFRRVIPWPEGADSDFSEQFGYNFREKLGSLKINGSSTLSPEEQRLRVDLFDYLSRRFQRNYFEPLRVWSRDHGLAHGGHLGGEDQLIGAARHGFGHVMRQLGAMDIPGVDIIWRQVFPGQPNHHFPKFASSAAHQNGTALSFTEAFCVYGNGLTPAQMKWLMDYQRVRGVPLLVGGCYPLSTRDHHMTGERPHFGPVNPLWDFLPAFHRDAARLAYVLACGDPDVEIALYYPVRDIWAAGDPSSPALTGHDRLAEALLSRQCDFDVIDDDRLCASATKIQDGKLCVGPMRYRTVVVGPTDWITAASRRRLTEFEAAGGRVVRVGELDRIVEAIARIQPTVVLSPPSAGIRVQKRRWRGGGAIFLFNEARAPYKGELSNSLGVNVHEVVAATNEIRRATFTPLTAPNSLAIELGPGESTLLIANAEDGPGDIRPPTSRAFGEEVHLSDGWEARIVRRYRVAEHDFETENLSGVPYRPVKLGRWESWVEHGSDFSGIVSYRRKVEVPPSFGNARVILDLGDLQYASRVWIDDREIGTILWPPYRVELPTRSGRSSFLLKIDVANTLANELTSSRVVENFKNRKGPGWPSVYHEQASRFERDSRGGGLIGPVRLLRSCD